MSYSFFAKLTLAQAVALFSCKLNVGKLTQIIDAVDRGNITAARALAGGLEGDPKAHLTLLHNLGGFPNTFASIVDEILKPAPVEPEIDKDAQFLCKMIDQLNSYLGDRGKVAIVEAKPAPKVPQVLSKAPVKAARRATPFARLRAQLVPLWADTQDGVVRRASLAVLLDKATSMTARRRLIQREGYSLVTSHSQVAYLAKELRHRGCEIAALNGHELKVKATTIVKTAKVPAAPQRKGPTFLLSSLNRTPDIEAERALAVEVWNGQHANVMAATRALMANFETLARLAPQSIPGYVGKLRQMGYPFKRYPHGGYRKATTTAFKALAAK